MVVNTAIAAIANAKNKQMDVISLPADFTALTIKVILMTYQHHNLDTDDSQI
jgi:hypothetical protein